MGHHPPASHCWLLLTLGTAGVWIRQEYGSPLVMVQKARLSIEQLLQQHSESSNWFLTASELREGVRILKDQLNKQWKEFLQSFDVKDLLYLGDGEESISETTVSSTQHSQPPESSYTRSVPPAASVLS